MSEQISQEGYIPVSGGRVWYRIVGTGPGIPLLTLHGGPGGNSGYLQTMAALADERPVIFYDQLGSGKSDQPDDPTLWVPNRFVEELVQVRAALGLPQFHLYGHSWGSMLATEYVLSQPAGLVSLILASPVLSVPRYIQDAEIQKRELPAEMQAAIAKHEADGTTDAPEYQAAYVEWLQRYMCRNESVVQAMLEGYDDIVAGINHQVEHIMWGPSDFSVTGNLKDFDRTARLQEIRVPTLFTCGRYDCTTPGATAWYQSLLPGSEMVVFEDSAHMTHLDEPELYIQTVRDFLRRVERHLAAS